MHEPYVLKVIWISQVLGHNVATVVSYLMWYTYGLKYFWNWRGCCTVEPAAVQRLSTVKVQNRIKEEVDVVQTTGIYDIFMDVI